MSVQEQFLSSAPKIGNGDFSVLSKKKNSEDWHFAQEQKSEQNWLSAREDSASKRSGQIQIPIDGNGVIEIPRSLRSIAFEIEKAKYILEYEDDWDEEGSKSYQIQTWLRVVKFVAGLAIYAYENYVKIIDCPKIFHSEDGSIDVLWKYPDYQLLANFPEGENTFVSFYGKDIRGQEFQGKFDPQKVNQGILMFLLDV